jgi:predicted glutamine amidotransferase
MCELFAVSSSEPAGLSVSFDEFARHGCRTGPNRDGFGIAFYDGRDALLIREPEPAGDSDWVRFARDHVHFCDRVIAHVRRASHGEPALANTHPFSRELAGAVHVFAHNGDLPEIDRLAAGRLHRYTPIGTTDSEHAFCLLMERMAGVWDGVPPPVETRLEIFAGFAAEMRALGPANFLYGDGTYVYAHGDRRVQADTHRITPPGLVVLCQHGGPVADSAAAGLNLAFGDHPVALVASVPLTDEPWEPVAQGETLLLHEGRIAARIGP